MIFNLRLHFRLQTKSRAYAVDFSISRHRKCRIFNTFKVMYGITTWRCVKISVTEGMKELYSHRKETIEKIFGTAKENHGFRYTQMYGKARMKMKVELTFACMNLKKLAKCKDGIIQVNLLTFFMKIGNRQKNILTKHKFRRDALSTV